MSATDRQTSGRQQTLRTTLCNQYVGRKFVKSFWLVKYNAEELFWGYISVADSMDISLTTLT